MTAPGRDLVVPHVQIAILPDETSDKSNDCDEIASQKMGLGSAWEASPDLFLPSRARGGGFLIPH
jgi:hypothetical protein